MLNMNWVDNIKEWIPEFAKDIRLNLDNVINRSTLDPVVVNGVALAAAVASGNRILAEKISSSLDDKESNAALSAAAIMAMTNVWYPYVEMTDDVALKGLPPQLRMNVIMSHGGTTKKNFEAYSLAASVVGKCHFCVKAHYDTLKKEGMTAENLRDIGRIAAVIAAAAKVYNG
jgi:alkyl hydroperoxide reductase subunit D